MANRPNLKNIVVGVLVLFPFILFYSLFFHFLTNIPYIDDFYWYFDFTNQFEAASSWSEKLTVFLEPYNNHRHYVQQLVILSFTYLFGELNIALFIILGNTLFLLFIYHLFGFSFTNSVGVIFSMWLFFQPISFMNYYTFAFFNLPVLLFSLVCIRSMSEQANVNWIILIGLVATFSNGNGLLVWLIGMHISFVQTNYKRLFIFSFVLIIILILYYIQDTYWQSVPIHNKENRFIDLQYFVDVTLFFIQIHASFINWSVYELSWLAIPVGLLVLLLFIRLLVRNKAITKGFNQAYIVYYLLFLSLSMALISLKRSQMSGLIADVVGHYRIYACIFLGCIVYYYTATIALTNIALTTILKFSIISIGIEVTLLNYKAYLPAMYDHFNHQLAEALNFRETEKWLFYPPIQSRQEYNFVNAVSKTALTNKVYVPFKPRVNQRNTQFELQVDSLESTVNLQVNNIDYLPLLESAFLVVQCAGLTYHFPVLFNRSWKDLKKLRFRQSSVLTVINWKAIHEPCLSEPSSIHYAVLRGNNLTYYSLSPNLAKPIKYRESDY